MIESVLADAKVIIYFKTRKKSAFFLTRSVIHHVNPTIDKRFSHTTSDRFQMHQRESSITTGIPTCLKQRRHALLTAVRPINIRVLLKLKKP
jgi:hypothetical protein